MSLCENLSKVTKEFKPVVLKITLETEDELRDMYHRMYLLGSEVRKTSTAQNVLYGQNENQDAIWYMINQICTDRGI